MTDAEVKKALECCAENKSCTDCPLRKTKSSCSSHYLDLINRQDAKIEQLEKQHIEDDKLLNDRVQEAVNAVSKANQKYVDSLEKAFNDRTAEKQNLEFENKELKAKVERLQAYHDDMESAIYSFREDHAKVKFFKNEIKAEAYKEFAERLKEYREIVGYDRDLKCDVYGSHIHIYIDEFDNLLNELVGDADA